MREIIENRIDALIEEKYKDQDTSSLIANLEPVIRQIISENLVQKKKIDGKNIIKLMKGMIEELPIGHGAKKEVHEVLPSIVKRVLNEHL